MGAEGGGDRGENFHPLQTPSNVPNFRAAVIKVGGDRYGYIRLYTFETYRPENWSARSLSTLNELDGTAGLILDIRDNPGGKVNATEGILQTLARKPLPPIVGRSSTRGASWNGRRELLSRPERRSSAFERQ